MDLPAKLLTGGVLVLLLGLSYKAFGDDNHVHVEQVSIGGDDFALNINQIGYDNLIRFSAGHDDNDVKFLQQGNAMYLGYTDAWGSGYAWGGDIDGLRNEIEVRQKCSLGACNDTDFQFHIWGDDNQVVFGQGYENNNSLTPNWSYDGNEPGGNFVRLDIHGDDNQFKGSQKQDSSSVNHSATVNIYADNNDVYLKQMQNGNKTLNMTIYNDWNEVAIQQKNNGAHTATITLNGTYATDLTLNQVGNSTQSYSLSQSCQTVGGCTLSVSQGN